MLTLFLSFLPPKFSVDKNFFLGSFTSLPYLSSLSLSLSLSLSFSFTSYLLDLWKLCSLFSLPFALIDFSVFSTTFGFLLNPNVENMSSSFYPLAILTVNAELNLGVQQSGPISNPSSKQSGRVLMRSSLPGFWANPLDEESLNIGFFLAGCQSLDSFFSDCQLWAGWDVRSSLAFLTSLMTCLDLVRSLLRLQLDKAMSVLYYQNQGGCYPSILIASNNLFHSPWNRLQFSIRFQNMKPVEKVRSNLLSQLSRTVGRGSKTLRPKNAPTIYKQKSSRSPFNITSSNLRRVYRSVEPSKRQFTTNREGQGRGTADLSSFLKTKDCWMRPSSSGDDCEQNSNKCEIILHENGRKRRLYYQVSKVKDLIEFLKQKEKNQSVITYCTIPTNLTHDFYLTKQDHDGSFFNKKTLHLKPYHKINKPKVDIRSFQIIKCIGSGGFSKVYLSKFKEDGKFYAMKLIQKQFILQHRKQEIVMNERNVMVQMDHPFIIPLKFAFQSADYVVFIVEYCPGGELFTYVKKYKRMAEEVAKFFIIEVLTGIEYLHQRNVIYRDIKPENILLDLEGHVRIADLGLAKPEITEQDRAYSFCGSPQYMPPEMILKVGHGRPVDYYCVGALLYQLLTGLPPFYNKNVDRIYQSALKEQLTFPKHTPLSIDCKKLLKGLLQKDSKRRLGSISGVKQILAHPWFGRINRKEVYNKNLTPPIEIDNEDNLQFDFQSKEDAAGVLKIQKQQNQTMHVFKKVMGNQFYYDSRKQNMETETKSKSRELNLDTDFYLKENPFMGSNPSYRPTSRRGTTNRTNTSGQTSSRNIKNIPLLKQDYVLRKEGSMKHLREMDVNRKSLRRLKGGQQVNTYVVSPKLTFKKDIKL